MRSITSVQYLGQHSKLLILPDTHHNAQSVPPARLYIENEPE